MLLGSISNSTKLLYTGYTDYTYNEAQKNLEGFHPENKNEGKPQIIIYSFLKGNLDDHQYLDSLNCECKHV